MQPPYYLARPALAPEQEGPTPSPTVTLMVISGYQDHVFQPHADDSQTVHHAAQVTYWPCNPPPPPATPLAPTPIPLKSPNTTQSLQLRMPLLGGNTTARPSYLSCRRAFYDRTDPATELRPPPALRTPQHPLPPTCAPKASCWTQRHMHEILYRPLPDHTPGPISTFN